MLKNKLFLFILVLVSGLLFYIDTVSASIIYADNTLSSNCTTGNYSIINHVCNGSDGNAFINIQDALIDMNMGDTVFVREGTYHEDNGNANAMIILTVVENGDSWEPGHFNTIASYPGEWAILDGEFSAPKGVVMGDKYMSTNETRYWVFERLGFTRGTRPGIEEGGAGLWVAGGPIKIRYCDFFNNLDDSQLNNPSGLTVYRLQNSIIEYNRFYNNGCMNGGNCTNIDSYSDYDYVEWRNDWSTFTIEHAIRKNEWRYNYFEGGDQGLKNKAVQMLTNYEDGSDRTWEGYGDKIHHNFFKNNPRSGVLVRQDFQQVYNNIFDSSPIRDGEWNSVYHTDVTIYNNTLIDSGYINTGPKVDTGFSYSPRHKLYNNIIYNAPTSGGVQPVIVGDYNSDDDAISIASQVIDYNYFYDITSTEYPFNLCRLLMSEYSYCGFFSVDEFNIEYGFHNYHKESSEEYDNLFQGTIGVDQYITREVHSIDSSVNIANGGIGGNHPYLVGVILPEYIGATNPNDNTWIEGVLNDVTNTNWLKFQGKGDPIWIEGSEAKYIDITKFDVNQDSQIDTIDAMLTLRNSLGLNMANTSWQSSETTGDVNCDGNLNSTDAMLLLRYSLDLDMNETGWREAAN